MLRLKRGDTVVVMRGSNRGEEGQVLRIERKRQRVIVQGINLVWKHIRRSQKHPQGGRIQKEASVHISNVMIYDPVNDGPTRVRIEQGEDGKRQRISVRSGKPV